VQNIRENIGFVQNNGRYSADRVRASPTNFSSSRNNGTTHNSYLRNQSVVQNIRETNGFVQNNERYSADRVRASPTNFCRPEIMVKHRTLIQGIKVLRNMSEEKMFKIIIIAIIVIHLLLNL